MRTLFTLFLIADDHPLSEEERAKIKNTLEETLRLSTNRIKADPKDVSSYSRRGDTHFFLGKFAESVVDYQKLAELRPDLGPSHWRLGLALYYAGRFAEAARQFQQCAGVDDVDRENGIWKFLSEARTEGIEKARRSLIKYDKEDREPLPAVYRMFEGTIGPGQLLQLVQSAPIDEPERQKRMFYAHLYAGLYFETEEKREEAARHLRKAVSGAWAPKAGYGPAYMWHLSRLHYELLTAPAK